MQKVSPNHKSKITRVHEYSFPPVTSSKKATHDDSSAGDLDTIGRLAVRVSDPECFAHVL